MNVDLVRCLPDTGAGDLLPWAIAGAILVAVGVVLVARSGGRRRFEAGAAAVRLSLVVVLALPVSVAMVMAVAGVAGAAGTGGCGAVAVPSMPGASTVVSPPKSDPTTPTAPPVVCPSGGDITHLPAGQTIRWTPIIEPDPRAQTGSPGQEVQVWAGNISGYHWSVVGHGTSSGPCNGTPTKNGVCVPYPQTLNADWFLWDATAHQWSTNSSAVTIDDGCGSSTSGGNS